MHWHAHAMHMPSACCACACACELCVCVCAQCTCACACVHTNEHASRWTTCQRQCPRGSRPTACCCSCSRRWIRASTRWPCRQGRSTSHPSTAAYAGEADSPIHPPWRFCMSGCCARSGKLIRRVRFAGAYSMAQTAHPSEKQYREPGSASKRTTSRMWPDLFRSMIAEETQRVPGRPLRRRRTLTRSSWSYSRPGKPPALRRCSHRTNSSVAHVMRSDAIRPPNRCSGCQIPTRAQRRRSWPRSRRSAPQTRSGRRPSRPRRQRRPSQQRSRSPARSLRASSAASRHCLHQTLSALPRRWPQWLRPSLMPKRPSLHGDSHQRRTLCSGRAARCTMTAAAAWRNSMRPRPWTAWASGLGLRCRATSDSPLKPTMRQARRQATRAVPRRCARCTAVSRRRCSPRAASSAGYRRVA